MREVATAVIASAQEKSGQEKQEKVAETPAE
jgi:hypothetical protein